MKKIICILSLCTVCLLACKTNSPVTPNDSNGSFTPPTTSYFIIDGTYNTMSGDAPHVKFVTGVRVTKPFYFSGGKKINGALQISFPYNSAVITDIPEGTSKSYYISEENKSDSKDSVKMNLQMDEYPKGVYLLLAKSGKIYMSKKNDTLQCISDGVLTVSGDNTLYPNTGDTETRTVKFSIRNGVSF